LEVYVSPEFSISLKDAADLRRFHMRVDVDRDRLFDLGAALRGIADLDGPDHAWVSVPWLMQSAGSLDANEQWHMNFGRMLDYAQRQNWIRKGPEGASVRAHVIWPDVPDHPPQL